MSYSENPTKRNTKGKIFIFGDGKTIGSKRISIDQNTNNPCVEKLIAEDIWQADSFEFGPDTVWIGKAAGLAAAGHHLLTENIEGKFHLLPHSDFDGEISNSDTKTLFSYYAANNQIGQADDSNEWIGQSFGWVGQSTVHGFVRKGRWKTGSVAATKPIRIETFEGTDENGILVFDQSYPPEQFPANITVEVIENGFTELTPGLDLFMRMSSDEDFSLLTNAEGTQPWTGYDVSLLRYDNLLQTSEWIDGATYQENQWFIKNRKIYICDVTGVQTGTFEDNMSKWHVLGKEHALDSFTETAIPYADSNGILIEDPTNLFYDASSYLHTPKLAIFDDDAILKRGHGLSIIRGADADVDIIHVNTQSTSSYFRYDFSEDSFWIDKGLKIKAFEEDEANLEIENGKLLINSIEIVGVDGEVNKAAVEDSANWDAAYTHSQIAGGDSVHVSITENSNWDAAYGWGDHSIEDYLISENDPVFLAQKGALNGVATLDGLGKVPIAQLPSSIMEYHGVWNAATNTPTLVDGTGDTGDIYKCNVAGTQDFGSGNITFNESDWVIYNGSIWERSPNSDVETDPIFTASQANNITNSGSGLVVTDTERTNWDTAFSWGDHESAGYETDPFDGDITEIFNSAGILKIMPGAQYDTEFFGDSDIGDAEVGKILSVRRRAVEDDDYIRLYVNHDTTGTISASSSLTAYGEDSVTLHSGTKDIIFRVGDDAGAKKTYFKNNSNGIVGSVDSLGKAQFNVSLDVPKVYNSAGLFKIQPDAQDDVEVFSDTDIASGVNGKIFKVWRRSSGGNNYIRMYVSSSEVGYIHANCPLTLQSQVPFTINSVTDDIIFKVGDNAGAKKVYFKDSDSAEIGSIDSNGKAWFKDKIGIGIAPAYDFHIEKDYEGPLTSRLYNSNANGISQQTVGANGGGYVHLVANSGPGSHLGVPVGGAGIVVDWGDMMVFSVGDTGNAPERMRLTPTGLGIGTTDPDYALHICRTDENSVLQIEATGANHGEANLFLKTQSDPGWQIFMDDSNLSVLGAADRLGFFHYGSAATRMVIDGSNGNVGIGTTDPKGVLHLSRSGVDYKALVFGDGDDDTFYIDAKFASTGQAGNWLEMHDLWGNNLMTWRDAKVGIGTTDPKEELHIKSDHPTMTFEEGDAASNEKVWEFGASAEEFSLKTANDLHTGNQTVWKAMNRGGTSVGLFVIPNAKVGIGTENVSGELTVDQSNTNGAIPVLTLDQGDADQPFIEFLSGTVYTGKSSQDQYLKVKVASSTRYLRLFN